MKIDIENQILIPFMVLIILSISVMTGVSYMNGYRLLLDNETKNYMLNLREMTLFMDKAGDDSMDLEYEKDYIISYYGESSKNDLLIIDNNIKEVLLNNSEIETAFTDELLDANLDEGSSTYSEGNYIFVYDIYERYNWIIGFRINKNIFFYDVLENEKNMILISIVAMVFSMQAAIFISYNISKPIRKLADYCDKIADSDGVLEKMELGRRDEIGVLLNAFNNMLDRLKSNREKIMEMTRFNEDILTNIPSGIITTDRYGRLLSVNEVARKLMHENTKKNRDIDIMEKFLAQLNETLNTSKVINNIITFNDAEGNPVYLDVTTSLLKGVESSVDGAICSFNDISDRKRFENNMDLLDRLTSIGQFAAGIAHEIRNPLTGMKTSIQVLENRLCKGEDQTNEKMFKGIIHEIDRINSLISGLLNFAKPRVSKFEKTDLSEVLDATLSLVGKSAKENDIEITVSSDCENTVVYADKAQIEQIFLNIIKNSISAVNKNGNIRVIFSRIQTEEGMYAAVDFHDNGCGIESKDMSKIFDPFFTTKIQGTGLGLSVVYELVKNNHGKIDVQSVAGEGTKVRIEFPAYGG